MITAGMDLGTQSVKVVVLRDGKVVARAKAFSGFDPTKAAQEAVEQALKTAGINQTEFPALQRQAQEWNSHPTPRQP